MIVEQTKQFSGYVVAGKKNCPNCDTAVKMLRESGADFMYVDVSETENAEMLTFIKESLGARVVPQIRTPEGLWIGSNLIQLREHLTSEDRDREMLLG